MTMLESGRRIVIIGYNKDRYIILHIFDFLAHNIMLSWHVL